MEGDWMSTGDLGEIMENGALKVIDRISNVYKLTQGEQIHPLKLEHIFM
jgi:long-chain acyl-CoA synthetase